MTLYLELFSSVCVGKFTSFQLTISIVEHIRFHAHLSIFVFLFLDVLSLYSWLGPFFFLSSYFFYCYEIYHIFFYCRNTPKNLFRIALISWYWKNKHKTKKIKLLAYFIDLNTAWPTEETWRVHFKFYLSIVESLNTLSALYEMEYLIIFTNPSARAGYDTRSIFKRSLTGLNSGFSFS